MTTNPKPEKITTEPRRCAYPNCGHLRSAHAYGDCLARPCAAGPHHFNQRSDGSRQEKKAMTYEEFLATKAQIGEGCGFAPVWTPDYLFDFQASLVEWSLRQGRTALYVRDEQAKPADETKKKGRRS